MGGPCCAHAVVIRQMRLVDVVRDYWRMLWRRPLLLPEEYSGPLVCRRCRQVLPEGWFGGGFGSLLVVGLLALTACSHGLQETAFRDEAGTYIVSRSLVSDRLTANQPHVVGVFACSGKYTDAQMREWRKDGAEHSQYSTCQPIEQYRPGAYQVTSDQPIGTLYHGPISAAILGGSLGAGLALSGDTVTQQGGGASAQAKSVAGKGRRR